MPTVEESIRLYNTLAAQYADVKPKLEEVNQYLLPGRNLASIELSEPEFVSFTTEAVDIMNDVGGDSLDIFTSLIFGTLTPPNVHWLEAKPDAAAGREPSQAAKVFMEELTKVVHKQLNKSNFYEIINEFYREAGGYCTAAFRFDSVMTGDTAYNFKFVPTGDYLFRFDYEGMLADFIRVVWKTPQQIVDKYGDDAPEYLRVMVDQGGRNAHEKKALLEHTYVHDPDDDGMSATTILIDIPPKRNQTDSPSIIERTRSYEMPYYVLRFRSVASTEWGCGPGLDAMKDIRRLQEMERTAAMAAHKEVDPPLQIPQQLEGMVNTLPGGKNYMAMGTQFGGEIKKLYEMRFDLNAAFAFQDRVERRIQKKFFVDVFFSEQRDPNKSPLKAAEVNVRADDKYLRLGPLVNSSHSKIFAPMAVRAIQILMRRWEVFQVTQDPARPQIIPDPPQEYIAGQDVDFTVHLVSPLAKQQNKVSLQPVQYMAALTQALAAIDNTVIDNWNMDRTLRSSAEASGLPAADMRTEDEVAEMRQQRYEAQRAQAQQQAQSEQYRLQLETRKAEADIAAKSAKASESISSAPPSEAAGGIL